jgi:L-lactate dehydrogenase complex protein LldF
VESEKMVEIRTEYYKEEAQKAQGDAVLQRALAGAQDRIGRGTAVAYRNFPEGPNLRLRGYEIRKRAVENLDVLLETLAEKVRGRGGHLFFAKDGRAAVDYCRRIARERGVRRIVKGKSMVTEEIGLNEALMADGIQVRETDLGQYIVQLAGETPSHIIAPAIHKTRVEVGELFAEKLGIPFTSDPPVLTQAARRALREAFLSAHMGISGCNVACAETGHVTTVSNEGNIRMVTTLPRIHMVFMGMERIVARLEDHDVILRLLAAGAAAQKMATYVSYLSGPRTAREIDGPEEFHLVILDNGRTRILGDPVFREILYCIRCAACLNVCPVYRKIGGHAYGHSYSGPIGAVLTPLMVGINRAKDLCLGETLCGACQQACPVNIDIPRMLLALRNKLAEGDTKWSVRRASHMEKAFYRAWSRVIRDRRLYELSLRLASKVQGFFPQRRGMIRRLPPPFHGWSQCRDMQRITGKSFIRRWRETEGKQ